MVCVCMMVSYLVFFFLFVLFVTDCAGLLQVTCYWALTDCSSHWTFPRCILNGAVLKRLQCRVSQLCAQQRWNQLSHGRSLNSPRPPGRISLDHRSPPLLSIVFSWLQPCCRVESRFLQVCMRVCVSLTHALLYAFTLSAEDKQRSSA